MIYKYKKILPQFLKGARRPLYGLVVLALCQYAPLAANMEDEPQMLKKHVPVLNDFIESALKFNPVIGALADSRRRYNELYKKESAFPLNPVFTVGYVNVPINTYPAIDKTPMTSVTFSLSQTIPMPGESAARNRAAYWKYIGETYRYWETRNQVILQIKILYHKLQFLYLKVQILSESEKALLDIVSMARALVAVNKMNSSHLLKMEADLQVLKNKLLEIKGQSAWFESKMEEMSGLRPVSNEPQNYFNYDKATSAYWMEPSDSVVIPENPDYEGHPLLLGIESALAIEESMLEIQKAMAFPAITVSTSYSYRAGVPGMDAGDDFISISVSAPIPVYYGGKEARAIKAQAARIEEMRKKREEVRLALSKGFEGEKMKAQNLLQAYKGYESEVLPRYHASYKALLGSLAAGTAGLLDVLDSYRLYLNSLITKAELYENMMISMSILEYYSSKVEKEKIPKSMQTETQKQEMKNQKEGK